MSRIRVNLIRSSPYSFKVHTYGTALTTAISIILFCTTILTILLFFLVQFYQRQVQTNALEYAILVRNNVSTSSTLGSSAYSYRKLSRITQLFMEAPEYVAQYEYILTKVIGNSAVDIDQLNFKNTSETILNFISEDKEALFNVLSKIEDEAKLDVFSFITLNAMTAKNDTRSGNRIKYEAQLLLKFKKNFSDKKK